MTINFCNTGEIEKDLFTLINKEITPGLSIDEISRNYDRWKELFDKKNDDFPILNKDLASDFCLPANKELVGVDYPTWFNISLINKKRVIILGIDPLRNEAAFSNTKYDKYNQAIIGTPYALHRKSMREGMDGNPKSYWKLIKPLLDKDYGIYLTDIFKVYFMSGTQRSYNNADFIARKEKHLKKILDIEIEIVKPHLIIVLGNKPLQLLNIEQGIKITDKISKRMDYNGTLVLPMAHLSGLASGGRKKFIANNLSDLNSDHITSYLTIIDNYVTTYI